MVPPSCRTLVLNADYRPLSYYPLSVYTWQEAIKDMILGRVHVISEYTDMTVRSPSIEFKVPSVVCLKRHVKALKDGAALTRYNVFLRDKFLCQYCGDRFDSRHLTLDHVIPRSRGGKTTWNNIVTCCHECNTAKSNKIPGKNYPSPTNKPKRPSTTELQNISRSLSLSAMHESWLDYI